MTWPALPLFMTVAGRPVILLGEGEAAAAKRRLLERAGAAVVGEDADAALAIVAIEDKNEAVAAVARLKARGVLVNAVDRPALCDFTVPAIVDRDPVLIAIGTGGASAGLAAALRQRLEALLPQHLGMLVTALHAAREAIRARFPDGADRRRAIGAALASGGPLDPMAATQDVTAWLATADDARGDALVTIRPRTADPDDLTLYEARLLAQADRVMHDATVPVAILDRARADAARIVCTAPPVAPGPGLTLYMEML
ncbi:MAG: bifunctional precorrin-2 dehydrogenase/sirohydrochlorin ferrochelatase [Sphingomonas bacterium]|uniref:precorrin-2 dehydrogenase/sirohydrochlorin ferrochelatase family protein n=1 Tax=Sphingomonas bacterium TaxID=1895847 RepID=UPI002624943B|nr:NAD(P)-dependent oxidoreductase [Sphingomonas bacterium]MDB5712314.1 bifunctional precorrin-2 dehydrogenase/sirohydrochlorin ferrochelatase [Sphingomonas bacterium]